MTTRERLSSDEGAVAIIVSLFLMVLLFLLALSIDINALRADIRHEQSTSDFAALAAGQELEPTLDYDPVGACASAWDYAVANLENVDNDGTDPCSVFSSLVTDGCTATTDPVVARRTVGDYTISITTPVPDDHELMGGRLDAEVDGWSCERVGVTVAQAREHIFGGITDSSGATTRASAVARAFALSTTGEFASLIILDRTGCDVLLASGQGTVVVDEYVDPDTGETTPGIIALDTRGTSCTSSQNWAIDATGNQNSRICVGELDADDTCTANGIIFSYGVRVGFGDGISSHDPSDITDGRLAPVPVGGPLVTREPGDHTYNCKGSYPLAQDTGDLQDPSNTIDGCDGDEATYIDDLVDALGTPGSSPGASFVEFPTDIVDSDGNEIYSCSENNLDIDLTAFTNVWINCPSKNKISPGFSPNVAVTLPGGGYIVVEDGIGLGSDASLTVGSETSDDTVLFLRDGDPSSPSTRSSQLDIASQSSIQLWNTFTYIHDGVIVSAAGGGSGPPPREGQPGDSACTDGADNDGDGGADGADPDGDCNDGEAGGGLASCTNGVDDDGDGDTDRDDSDCELREGPIGNATCSDGVDNDGDGDTDLADDGCEGLRRFIAPLEGAEDNCTSYVGLPPQPCFEDLILWTNSPLQHTMAGQGVLDLQGVFFTPNAAPFSLAGGTDQTLSRAQFIAHRIQVSGQGTIRMSPNPEFNLETDLTGGGLIR